MPETRLDTLPAHPRTGVRAVGYRRDGRPIWPILGGSTDSDPAAAPAGEATTQHSAEAGSTPAPPAGPDASTQAALDTAAQQATEATERADKMQQALDAVAAALNPDGAQQGGQDPAQLAAAVTERDTQLADLDTQLRTAQVELAAYKAAGSEGARADRLLNSRAFLDSVAGLDPASPKFEQQLGAAITAAVEADPDLYRAAPAGPSRGGAEFNGPPAADQRPKSLHDAVAAQLGG